MRSNSELFSRLNESTGQSDADARLIVSKVLLEVLLDCRDLLTQVVANTEKGKSK